MPGIVFIVLFSLLIAAYAITTIASDTHTYGRTKPLR